MHGTNLTQLSADETFRRSRAVEEIAFQTSLLALHAAVEAADGGERGSGIAAAARELAGLLRGCEHGGSRRLVDVAVAPRAVEVGKRG